MSVIGRTAPEVIDKFLLIEKMALKEINAWRIHYSREPYVTKKVSEKL